MSDQANIQIILPESYKQGDHISDITPRRASVADMKEMVAFALNSMTGDIDDYDIKRVMSSVSESIISYNNSLH